MGQPFKFNILTGENAPDKYAAITIKDPMTFYLLETGVGYFRGKKLFDVNSGVRTIDTINEENPSDDIPTEKAIVEYIVEALRDKVPYEIDGEPGDEEDNSQTPTSTPSTPESNLETTDTIDDDTPTSKIPTVAAIIDYVTQTVEDEVSFYVNSEGGIKCADGGWAFPTIYSTSEVRIGTWIDGKPLYRRVFELTLPSNIGTTNILPSIPYIKTRVNLQGLIKHPVRNDYYSIYNNDSISVYFGSVGIWAYLADDSVSEFKSQPVTILCEYTKTTD